MKRAPFIFGTALLGLIASTDVARAEDIVVTTTPGHPYDQYNVGIGAVLGDPTALTLKGRFDENNAVQLHVGWGLVEPWGSRFVLAADYLWHFIIISDSTARTGSFTPYLGLGAKLGLREQPDSVVIGGRIPLGLAFLFREAPIEIFLEIVPGVHVYPAVSMLFDAGLGARVYF